MGAVLSRGGPGARPVGLSAYKLEVAADLFEQKAEGTAWRSKPSWYIVATKDRTVQPDLERFVAKRMGATTYETDGSPSPCSPIPASCWTLSVPPEKL